MSATYFPFDVEIPDLGAITFFDPNHLREWIQKELDYWSWINSIDRRIRDATNAGATYNRMTSQLQEVFSRMDSFTVDDVRNRIVMNFTGNGAPHSSTPRAAFIRRLRDINPIVALGAAQYLSGTPLKVDAPSLLFKGYHQGVMYELGNSESAESAVEAFGKLMGSAREELAEYSKEHTKLVESGKDQTDLFEKQRNEIWSRFELALMEMDSKLESLKARFLTDYQLQAPRSYWSAQADHHNKWANIFTGVFFVVLVSGGIGFWFLADNELSKAVGGDAVASIVKRFATLGLIATFIAWALRVLSRLMMSHTHLANDARERTVQIDTYLGLIESKAQLEPGDRGLILQSIFKPTATGLIDNDAIPPAVLDLAMRMKD